MHLSSSPRPSAPGLLFALRSHLPLRILGWISLPFYPLSCLFIMDYMNYSGSMEVLHTFWQKHPGSAAFEVVVTVFLFTVLTLLIRRIWVSAALFALLSLVFSYINYMKAALNGDHFYPQDIAMVAQVGELTSFLSGSVPQGFWSGAAVLALWAIFFWLIGLALPRPAAWRWLSAAALLAIGWACTSTDTKIEQLLSRFGMSTFDSALQSSNYSANGFVGAFTLNALTTRVTPPDDYSQQSVQALLEGYQAAPAAPDAEVFDVVVVLSESFFDPRILPGVSFSENPLIHYDRLTSLPNCQSGMLYTTAVGGGTVRPEFGVLTGLTTDYLPNVATPYCYVTDSVPSYVSHYKQAGYTTIALHPYDKKFYSRDQAYPHLCFDVFYGQDEMSQLTELSWKRNYISDAATARAIVSLVDSQTQPVFLFAITMQNHQPFHALPEEEIRIQAYCPALSESSHTALTTYTQGLYDADQMLGTLADWVGSRERPTVLVFFGDHLPTLGSNHLAYNETGFLDSSDGLDSAERQKLYSTPFLIYCNRTVEDGLLQQGSDNHISDYNLLNSVLRSTGMSTTAYTELLADFYSTVPFYNVRLLQPETEDSAFFTRAMRLITYDRLLGKGWSK